MSYASGINNLQQTINSIPSSEARQTTPVSSADRVSKETAGSIANVAQADQANLSLAGGLVAQALEDADTRSAKVASLQQAIAAGSYSVSSSDVAVKIIQSLLG
jgi:negative regulator of flagellin synthesis FlgM